MANRGMLPKFRPATLGERHASLRPAIRPVKPTAPPPPPSPPRRFSSGIRSGFEAPQAIEGQPDLVTPPFSDPPTMAARERIHAIARELPREQRFEDETQARQVEEHGSVAASLWSPGRRAEMDVAYDSLPSLEANQDNRYHSQSQQSGYEPDPSTQMSNEEQQGQGPQSHYPAPLRGSERNERGQSAYEDSSYADSYSQSEEQDRFPGYRDEQREEYSARDSESEPAPPAQRFNTAGYPGMPVEDSYGGAPSQVPQYDVAAYEANYPGVRRDDSYAGSDERVPRREATYREASRDREHERDLGFQATEHARVDDYPSREREASHRGNDRVLDPNAQETHCPQKSPRRGQSYRRDVRETLEESPGDERGERDHGSYQREAQRDERREQPGSYRRDASPQPGSYRRDERHDAGHNAGPNVPTNVGQSSYRRDDYAAESHIPQAPAVPREMKMPANFVMGVQPLRTGSMGVPGGSFAAGGSLGSLGAEFFPPHQHQHQPPRHHVPRTPAMGVPYGAPPAQPVHRAMTPRPMTPQHMHVRVPTNRPQQPVGHQLQMTEVEEAQQGSKVGRFAWFVFGAAFGIFFAFFATGFVPRLGGKKDDTASFPPPVQIPTQQAPSAGSPSPSPPPPAPPQVVAVAPPPVQVVQQPPMQSSPPMQMAPQQVPAPMARPGAMAPAPVAMAPAQPMMAAPQPMQPMMAAPQPMQPMQPMQQPAPQPIFAVAPAPAPKPAFSAPARGQRASTIARRSAPPPSVPKAMSNSARDDDDAPAPAPAREKPAAPSKEKGDIGDLLNAGLAP
jgi:hypothetical protein